MLRIPLPAHSPLALSGEPAPCPARPASVPAVIAAVPRQRLPKKAIDEDAASSPIRRGGIAGALHTPARGCSCQCAEGGGQGGGTAQLREQRGCIGHFALLCARVHAGKVLPRRAHRLQVLLPPVVVTAHPLCWMRLAQGCGLVAPFPTFCTSWVSSPSHSPPQKPPVLIE